MSIHTVFTAWYRRADWPAIRAMSADKAGMAVDFDTWLIKAQAGVSSCLEQGQRVIRVEVNPRELAAFAARNGVPVDAHCRTTLAVALGQGILEGIRSECPID